MKYAVDQNTIFTIEISEPWEKVNFLVFSHSHITHLPCDGKIEAKPSSK